MKICWYGGYKENYSRNIILKKALLREGYEIKEFKAPLSETTIELTKKLNQLLKEKDCDIIFIGFPAYRSVIFGKIASKIKNIPLLYDAFISKYNTYVEDKKIIRTEYKKKLQYYKDLLIYSLPNYITLDTYQHIKYFILRYNLNPEKFERILLGTDTDIFYPRENTKKNNKKTIIKFHGIANPLQGIPNIVKAAHILKSEGITDVEFHLLGKGEIYLQIMDYIKKFKLHDIVHIHYTKIPYQQLPEYMKDADIYLGIFGNTLKANMVVPNKVYEALGMGLPLITQQSPAIKEVGIKHKTHAYLVEGANPRALADAILELKGHPSLREKLGKNAYKITKKKFSIESIGKEISSFLNKII